MPAPIITADMLNKAYGYLASLSSMVGWVPEDQVKSVMAQVFRIMYAEMPKEAAPPPPHSAPAPPAA